MIERVNTNRIKELRKQARLSQESLGVLVGCNKSKISKLENGNQELTQNWMIKITRALNNSGISSSVSDLLPYKQAYRDEIEKDFIIAYKRLDDSQKTKIHAMIESLK